MGDRNSGKTSGQGPEPQEAPSESAGFSSPPCMLHELDPSFVGFAERVAAPARPPETSAAQDWEEVRLWRKAKRAVLIERRLAMPAAVRSAHSEAITAALLQTLPSAPGKLLGFYWSFKGEYDPRPLARCLHTRGVQLALPVVVEKANPLVFREWWPGAPMTHGIWNIPVPAEGGPVSPDVLLVPLVGFDSQQFRLGYGGGYYDRTLATMPSRPRTVGVGFELSRIATIHPQSHDIPMDIIVTECRTG